MNVIVANEKQNELSNLDIDIIKSISGSFDVLELVEMFKSFFYNKMILDVTALKNYQEIRTYDVLSKGLDPDKLILLLPEGSSLCTPNFLGHLISMGIYNFTSNLNGIKYLLKKTNTLQDVEHIRGMANAELSAETGANVTTISSVVQNGVTILGFRDVTEQAGATTLIYMLKKELSILIGQDSVGAIEVNKNDFALFNEKNMVSTSDVDVKSAIAKFPNARVIFVDLNNCRDDSFCADVIYLIEPSTIKLNKLVKKNRIIFSKLQNRKVILNQSLLLNSDVFDFESEAGIKVFYNMPPLDERKRNAIIGDFLAKLGILQAGSSSGSSKIFGLFRR